MVTGGHWEGLDVDRRELEGTGRSWWSLGRDWKGLERYWEVLGEF